MKNDKLPVDGGYQEPVFAKGQKKAMPGLAIETIKRSDIIKGFEVLPRRWMVERTFAWLGRCRRQAKDFENHSRNALVFLKLASICLMMRRLCSK
jgi:transposase